jgi:uncharacterized membrane protein YfcA
LAESALFPPAAVTLLLLEAAVVAANENPLVVLAAVFAATGALNEKGPLELLAVAWTDSFAGAAGAITGAAAGAPRSPVKLANGLAGLDAASG